MSAVGKSSNRQQGFTYPLALLAVAVISILAGIGSVRIAHQVQVEKEAELLFRGLAYRRAIRSYYLAASPHAYPRRLEDLLKDPRFAHRRYMRALYPDPFGDRWQLIHASDGGIAGIASSSTRQPIKRFRFPLGLEQFEKAKTYRDWQFVQKGDGGIKF